MYIRRFVLIKSQQQEMVEKIITERKKVGSYLRLQDFIEPTDITKEQLIMLISIGAFRFTRKSKKKLLWEANFLQKKNKVHTTIGQPMFEEVPIHFELPNYLITGWMICMTGLNYWIFRYAILLKWWMITEMPMRRQKNLAVSVVK